jgi:predicted AAA+ superfamily ATPase
MFACARCSKLTPKRTWLLTHLTNVNAEHLARDGALAGSIFETFVAMELARQCDWADSHASLFHYRDRFKAGVIIYTGERSLPFGDRLTAVPLQGLWAGT